MSHYQKMGGCTAHSHQQQELGAAAEPSVVAHAGRGAEPSRRADTCGGGAAVVGQVRRCQGDVCMSVVSSSCGVLVGGRGRPPGFRISLLKRHGRRGLGTALQARQADDVPQFPARTASAVRLGMHPSAPAGTCSSCCAAADPIVGQGFSTQGGSLISAKLLRACAGGCRSTSREGGAGM